jgi:hypothetical protein
MRISDKPISLSFEEANQLNLAIRNAIRNAADHTGINGNPVSKEELIDRDMASITELMEVQDLLSRAALDAGRSAGQTIIDVISEAEHLMHVAEKLKPRTLPDGRELHVLPLLFGRGRLGITKPVGMTDSIDDDSFGDVWEFPTLDAALAAQRYWNPQEQIEPVGWDRHPKSGRRAAKD